jgi:site-specific recombinase XerD
MEKLPLPELVKQALSELQRLNYSKLTIREHRYSFNKVLAFAEQTGETFFSEGFGTRYLKDVCDYPSQVPLINREPVVKSAVRAIKKLGEYQLYGAFTRKGAIKNPIDWSLGDRNIVDAYVDSVQTADHSDATKRLRIHHIKLFYDFLGFQKTMSISDVTAKNISDYAMSLQGGSVVYAKHRLATLRYYFRYLYKNGYCKQDLSHSVPSVIAPKNMNVPALWSKDEIELLLKSIDRGGPAGKRDYAILLLVIQLGIRIADIAKLQLEHLKWERKEIVFAQHKTGNNAIFPMLDETGWALIDYVRYARPQSDDPHVFLTCNAPYTYLHPSSVGCILKRWMLRCGIHKKGGTVSGMHSLRHALARRLLEQGTPLSTVAQIMGHTSYCSTSPYLKVDIDGLRDCALSLEGVLCHD